MSIDATQPYDDGNIFAKILRGEIPSNAIYEDEIRSHSRTSTRRRQPTSW